MNRSDRPQLTAYANAYAERWVRSVKEECLSRLIFFGVRSLRTAIENYLLHYHHERTHQSLGNAILFLESSEKPNRTGPEVHRRQRLGGLLSYYYRTAA